jgi:hypothetical protein
MRNRDTIMLEEAYNKIALRGVISEDTSEDAVKALEDAIKAQAQKPSDPTLKDTLDKAWANYYRAIVQKTASASPAPQTQSITAPDSQSAEEKAKSMMDASGNSPKVSVSPQPVAPAPQPAAATVAPKPVSATPTPAPAPEQKAPAPIQPQQTTPKAPAAFVSPTANELTKFRKETGTNFNPSSRNDKLGMSLMRKGKPTLNTKQANAYRKANPNWTPKTV